MQIWMIATKQYEMPLDDSDGDDDAVAVPQGEVHHVVKTVGRTRRGVEGICAEDIAAGQKLSSFGLRL